MVVAAARPEIHESRAFLWALFGLGFLLVIIVLQLVLRFLFGEQVANDVVANLLTRSILAVVRILRWPFRRILRAVRRSGPSGNDP